MEGKVFEVKGNPANNNNGQLSLIDLVDGALQKARRADTNLDGNLDTDEIFKISTERCADASTAQLNAALLGAFHDDPRISNLQRTRDVLAGARNWREESEEQMKAWTENLRRCEALASRAFQSSTSDRGQLFNEDKTLGPVSCAREGELSAFASCLSSIARNHPNRVKQMISVPVPLTEMADVRFPGLDKFVISTRVPTAAEAASHLTSDGHGLWPTHLAKAFGQVRKELGWYGNRDALHNASVYHQEASAMIIQLLTGKQADYALLRGAPQGEAFKHDLATMKAALDEKRIVVVETSEQSPLQGRVIEVVKIKLGDGVDPVKDQITVYDPGCTTSRQKGETRTLNGLEFAAIASLARFEGTKEAEAHDDLNYNVMTAGQQRMKNIHEQEEKERKAMEIGAPQVVLPRLSSLEKFPLEEHHKEAYIRFRPEMKR